MHDRTDLVMGLREGEASLQDGTIIAIDPVSGSGDGNVLRARGCGGPSLPWTPRRHAHRCARRHVFEDKRSYIGSMVFMACRKQALSGNPGEMNQLLKILEPAPDKIYHDTANII